MENLTPSKYKKLPQRAYNHRVLHLLGYYSEHLPEGIAVKSKEWLKKLTQQSLEQCVELLRITAALQAKQISFTTLKGIPLSYLLYDDIGKRQSSDIDILISKEDLGDCRDLFIGMGYRQYKPEFRLKGKAFSYYKRLYKDIVFVHSDKEVVIEVHFKCFKFPDLWDVETIDLIKTSRVMLVGGQKVPYLHLSYMLAYLFAHGAKHRWRRLRWLLDIALLIPRVTVGEWDNMLTLLRGNKLERCFEQGVALLRRLFQFELPFESAPFPKGYSDVWLVTTAIRQLRFGSERIEGGIWKRIIYRSRLKSGQLFKIKVFLFVFFVRAADWGKGVLPDTLFIFYFLLRPAFWLGRQLTGKTTSVK